MNEDLELHTDVPQSDLDAICDIRTDAANISALELLNIETYAQSVKRAKTGDCEARHAI